MNLGIQQAFTKGADFSAISDDKDLYIDSVIQSAHLQVDEKGVEASAATEVSFALRATLAPPNKKVMRCDRPFFLLIREKKRGETLFIAKVVTPNTP